MSDFSTALLNEMGLVGYKAIKQRGSFICTKTDREGEQRLRVHKTFASEKAVLFESHLMRALAEKNFFHTDWAGPYISSRVLAYAKMGRDVYGIKRLLDEVEPDFSDLNDLTLVIERLANFHQVARGEQLPTPPAVGEELSVCFAKNSDFLKKQAKELGGKKRLSDFDIIFLKNVQYYIDVGMQSADMLASTDYHLLYQKAVAEQHICHNNIKEDTMPLVNGECHMVRFVNATVDCQLMDLAELMWRHGRSAFVDVLAGEEGRTGSDEATKAEEKAVAPMTISQIFEIYCRICPQPPWALTAIKAQLIHPWQFIKLTKEYYSKNRGWTPIVMMEQLEKLVNTRKLYEDYVYL